MGQPRPRPTRLAEKLLEIRRKLDLSQNEMIRRMELSSEITQNRISAYELGEREPPLFVLLAYARACGSGAYLEYLIDDDLDLPNNLPDFLKGRSIKKKSSVAKKR
jgi:transcriptional regulator with XRE-family HTH domain